MNLKKVKVFGERHTGTNAMQKLVSANFGIQVPNHGLWGWKHRIAPTTGEVAERDPNNETLFIIMLRNPYDWCHAMWKRPYNCHDPKGNQVPFSEFIRKPFEDYSNLPAVWATKYLSYYLFEKSVENVMFFSMEKLSKNPWLAYSILRGPLESTVKDFIAPKYMTGTGTKDKDPRGIEHHIKLEQDDKDFIKYVAGEFLLETFDYGDNSGKVSV